MNLIPGKRFPQSVLQHPSRIGFALFTFLLAWNSTASLSVAAKAPKLQLQVSDRIAIVGNGFADRMQHDGWLEAHLQARHPQHKLVVRNLSFTGDELTVRLRSDGFGSPEDWLRRTKANVVFACFGFNESFQSESGIDKFKSDLRQFVLDTQTPEADSPARRVVLFSPTACEDLQDPLLPDPESTNKRLLAYTDAMAAVAAELEVPFVDLFHPTLAAMQSATIPLTINGIHFEPNGNGEVARIIANKMFGETGRSGYVDIDAIRQAVCDKNFYWFQRYRTTDGYSIFGGRKGTGGSKWTPDNEKVMLREMEVLEVMTANRDAKIWAAAQGTKFQVDDSNAPPLIPVATNRPGPLGDGSYPFLGGEEAIERMTVAPGMAVNLFASEEQFPELQNPVQAAVDTKGRLWVAAWPSYPHWKPTDEMNDKLLIFTDDDGDGRADSCKVFADGLHNPTGFEFYNGGVYVAQIPDIWFFKDTDGDDVADVRQRVIGGIDSADTHHSINSFVVGPGGGLYFQEGLFHRSQMETPHGPPVRVTDAGVFRYDPRDQSIVPYANYRFANPHGHVFTYWGDDIIHDGTSAVPMFGPAISGRTIYPNKHRRAPPIYAKRTRPCAGTALLSSSHFPGTNRDNLLVCNVIGEQGVLQYELLEDGAGVKGIETEPLVMSTDPNFRPVGLEVGADGAVFVLDWQNPLIGHLQHNLRDSNRDHLHGRIYRIRCQERDLLQPPQIAGQTLEHLFDMLTHRDNAIRYRVKIELSARPPADVIAACEAWVDSLSADTTDYEHHLLEAIWVHQHNHVVNEPLLRRLLRSTDHRVRAAAGHVLRAWRTRIRDAQQLIARLVRDEHPKVRLVGVLICSDVDTVQSAELALEAAKLPRDKFLNYVLKEATKTLAPIWQQALASGQPFCQDNPAAMSYLLQSSSPRDILSIVRGRKLLRALLLQPKIDPDVRYNALLALAKHDKTAPLDVLLDLLSDETDSTESTLSPIVDMLAKFDPKSLQASETQLLELASGGNQGVVRQAALAALASIDDSAERTWELANASASGLIDVLKSIRRIEERETRVKFYSKVRPLVLDPHTADIEDPTENTLLLIQSSAVDAMAQIPRRSRQKLDDLLTVLETNRCRPQVIHAIRSIPRRSRTTEAATRLVAATSTYLATLGAGDRAGGDAARELKLAVEFAELLPNDQRVAAIEKLERFAVRTLKLATIPHRMAYDQQKLVVQADEPVQLVFENADNMPHNFVLIEPGFLSKVGLRAEAEATLPATIARQYVPNMKRILLSSNMLQPQTRQVINFNAPKQPGMYPYVCTYPGHWRRMFGTLVVVDDVSQYEADPKTYLAKHSIEPRDELLKFNRPLKNWKLEELRPALDRLANDRAFDRGSALFQAASCGSCHSVPAGKSRFAPDLTKLDSKRTPEIILRSILEPSHTIEDKYQMSKFLLDSGKVVVGLVVEETDEELVLMIDPLVSCEPTIIAKDEIEERYQSEISLMPAGLLDRFTEEEILELCAFLVARGDKEAPIYQATESAN